MHVSMKNQIGSFRSRVADYLSRRKDFVMRNLLVLKFFLHLAIFVSANHLLRELAASQKDVLRRLDEMEGKYDRQFKVVLDAIRELMQPPKTTTRIGY